MFKKGDKIRTARGDSFLIVRVDNRRPPAFKYELRALDGRADHAYFMGESDALKYKVVKVR